MTVSIVVLQNSKEFKTLDTRSGGQLSRAAAELKDGEGITIAAPNKISAQFVRVENRRINTESEARDFGGEMYSLFKDRVDTLEFSVSGKFNNDIQEGTDLAGYEFLKYKTDAKTNRLQSVVIKATGTTSIASSINFARDLITEPGNVLYPREYAKRISQTLGEAGVTVKVYDQEELAERGFNLLLSVGQGSTKASQVVVMEWLKGGNSPTIALVGKGVTFDSGGISLKPGKGMGDMKYDMAGSAAVVGAMHAIATHNINKNVVGIVGLVENMPDGNSIKPGDVVTSLSGQTVENLNTDAEGRLVLADILTHVQTYNPATIIDLATLTGAIMVALGTEMAGLFTNSTQLEQEIVRAGKTADEHYWRMPMGQNWNKQIDSTIADMQNIGGAYGGSTTAAEFLYRFVDEGRAWCHLDIAGVAWADKSLPTVPRGAVGFGIRTLFNLVSTGKISNLSVDEAMKY